MENQKSQSNSNTADTILSFEITEKLLDAYVMHKQLFLFKFPKYKYQSVYRLLTITEIEAVSNISKICDYSNIEDWIIKKCLIYESRQIDLLPMGVANKLAAAIMKSSNINDTTGYIKLLEENRKANETLPILVQSIINRVYPTFDAMSLTYPSQIKLLSIAEKLTGEKIILASEKPNKRNRSGPRTPTDFVPIGGDETAKAEAQRILSQSNADKPDFERDNAFLKGS